MRITDEELMQMADAIKDKPGLWRRAFAAAVAKDCARMAQDIADAYPVGLLVSQAIKERYGVE